MLMPHRHAIRFRDSISVESAHSRLRILLLHSSLCLLFVGMPFVVASSANQEGSGSTSIMAAILGAVTVLALALHTLSPPVGGISGIFAILIVLETLAGLPGLIFPGSGDSQMTGFAFIALLAARNYVCFWGLPAARPLLQISFDRFVLSWALAATTLFAIATLWVARTAGLSLGSSERMTGERLGWVNANTIGVYCAFGLLICIIARFMPIWVRLAAGGLALYCLLLSQSRSAIITIILSGSCGFLVARKWNAKAIVLAMSALFLISALVDNSESFESIQSNPYLSAIVQRFQNSSGKESTRLEVISNGFDVWKNSPVFGLGYEAPDTRFENGYLSLACETGAIGLLLYLSFVALASIRSLGMLQVRAGSEAHELGGYLLCVTVFILVHGIGERTHGFQIGAIPSNVWALLAASVLGPMLSSRKSVL
jgi:O-antigen ligase